MIALKVTVQSAAAVSALEGMTAPVALATKKMIGLALVAAGKDNIAGRRGPDGSAWPRGPGTTLYGGQRTWNDISRSITAAVTGEGNVAVGPTHVAGAVRHLGTVGAGGTLPDIVPVKKKALTIPLNDAASKASYQGQTAREAFPDAFLLTKDGRHGASPLTLGVIARKVGGRKNRKTGQKENQELELLYLLTRRAAIRPHPYMPVDAGGRIAPPALGTEIDTLIIDNFFGKNGVGL